MNGYYRPPPAGREYICGLYYIIPSGGWRLEKNYLPQIELQAHATILATTSRTVLTQTFVNPSTKKGIKECRYTFPLYDGVSVVGFTCHIGDRTIIGEVKEREKARAVFQQAVARGETAGLLEQLPDASDVFTTTVGNVPPGAKVIIKVTYLGELKHDMEVDGIRFTIPNTICPRYGNYPGTLRTSPATGAMGGSISIIVDAEMADGSFIQKIQSPTHPIAVTMGTTSLAPNAEPTMTKASATLTLGTTMLDTDFVLQVIAKDTGIPKAILECHPTIPNHRALMATLVPKFALPPEKPEIVFVCDRSGSMDGSRIDLAIQALKVFLKSLPIGVKFNICSFGSRHSFLWQKSVTYTQQTLDEAVRHAETFSANYGGTEMLEPLRATIEQRYKDMPLEVMMLTDGKTWNQQQLFTYLNSSVTESKAPIRVFTLGIGDGVSHALIESMAKAGNGFSQTVGDNEKMDSKVVRMLKGALSPHINDYSLEVNYSVCPTAKDDDDFEIIERVADSLKIKLDLSDKEDTKKETKKQISLFDTSADPDKEEPPVHDATGENRYAHLPKFPAPKIVQAPQNIPSLFAFNRTTVYLLLGPDAPQAMPKSVILRGTSAYGPLELEIPIHFLDLPGETIHQLAAKRAISELEQGRGWLSEAKDETGAVIKTKFEGRFDDMVEREAVRLGVKFQVGGKWCSFVAVESNKKNLQAKEKEEQEWEWLEDEREENISQADRQNGSQLQSLEQGSSLPPQDIEAIKARMDQLRDRGDLPRTSAYMHTPSLLPYKIARTDSNSPPLATTPKSEEEVLHYLIGLQTFEGCWEWSNALNVALTSVYTLDQAQLMRQVDSGVDTKLFATALVVMVFEEKLAKWKGSWELVVEKARVWLEGEFGVTGLEKILETARNVVK
ncbi:von Willebrand domain-containing protein [Clathrospora elynae]|uniref:von Willebrand domain-containing protein n=1 Tax=Clathrospora elynae TaxID=706981 RepID=A0A6A5SIR1_9PLEO|nr:von Willebrand domain-containing protein [Clathrospora elynae]